MTLKQEKGNRKTRKIDPCCCFLCFPHGGGNLQTTVFIIDFCYTE